MTVEEESLAVGQGCLSTEEMVNQGLTDLAKGKLSESALLVLVAGPRLRGLGIFVPEYSLDEPYEDALYTLIEERLDRGAHPYYNSLIRRIVNYARAMEKEQSRLRREQG
jgi:hypothetical protein